MKKKCSEKNYNCPTQSVINGLNYSFIGILLLKDLRMKTMVIMWMLEHLVTLWLLMCLPFTCQFDNLYKKYNGTKHLYVPILSNVKLKDVLHPIMISPMLGIFKESRVYGSTLFNYYNISTLCFTPFCQDRKVHRIFPVTNVNNGKRSCI